MLSRIPLSRIKVMNTQSINAAGAYVLYWMTSARRSTDNFALQHALFLCEKLGKPLMVFEPLRSTYRWASDRIHNFVIEGMIDNLASFDQPGVSYFPYVELEKGMIIFIVKNVICVLIKKYTIIILAK